MLCRARTGLLFLGTFFVNVVLVGGGCTRWGRSSLLVDFDLVSFGVSPYGMVTQAL